MPVATVRISEESHHSLKELAERTGQTMIEVLDRALETYRRKLFFEQMNAGYAEMRADRAAWAEHQAEQSVWDTALLDGLDPDENRSDQERRKATKKRKS